MYVYLYVCMYTVAGFGEEGLLVGMAGERRGFCFGSVGSGVIHVY